MFGMMLMKAFLKWEVQRECKENAAGAFPVQLMMHGAADTAVHPASVRESSLGDLPFFFRIGPKSPGQGRLGHFLYETFLHSNLNAYHWDILD